MYKYKYEYVNIYIYVYYLKLGLQPPQLGSTLRRVNLVSTSHHCWGPRFGQRWILFHLDNKWFWISWLVNPHVCICIYTLCIQTLSKKVLNPPNHTPHTS